MRKTKSTEKLDHIKLYEMHLAQFEIDFTNSVMMDTSYIGRCKSNFHIATCRMVIWVILDGM